MIHTVNMTLKKAIRFAKQVHREQRSISGEAATVKNLKLMKRLKALGCDIDCQIAGVLHDCYELSSVPLAELRQQFGEAASFMIYSLSKDPLELFSNDLRGEQQRILRHLDRLRFGICRHPDLLTIAILIDLESLRTILTLLFSFVKHLLTAVYCCLRKVLIMALSSQIIIV